MGELVLRYMDYAYTVYAEKSFTKAAEKLYISQPALSLTIKKLERDIGATIFERSGKEVYLTEVGEKYIKFIEEIRHVKGEFEKEVDDMMQLKKGKVVIGSTPFIASSLLVDIIKVFKENYSELAIDLIIEQSTMLKEKMRSGMIDIVIDNVVVKEPDCEYLPICEEKIFVGVPRNRMVNYRNRHLQLHKEEMFCNDITKLPRLPISELKDEPFVLLKSGNKMRQIADKMFTEAGIIPKISLEFDQLMTTIDYANSGFGACLLTDTAIKYGKECNELIFYMLDNEPTKRIVYVCYKKNKYLTFATREFLRFVFKEDF